MNDKIIQINNLSKRYRIGLKEELHDSLIGKISSIVLAPFNNFRKVQKLSKFEGKDSGEDIIWALKEISLDIKQGEIVGIIGRNGAGKSTLLKILSRIVEPTGGTAIIKGRVASLLEIGTGFHKELSGRENIYLNGTILGMKKDEITDKFEEIVQFSEIGKFIDTPVKRYSSGMYVRLAFAVSAHLNPEILIVDEVLSVGDAAFQKKCIGKMSETAKSGRTVLFVSHNMHTIQDLCNRTILLEDGKIALDGTTSDVIRHYLQPEMIKTGESDLSNNFRSRKSPGKLRAKAIRILDKEDKICSTYEINDSLTIELDISNVRNNGFAVSFLIFNQQGALVYQVRSQDGNIVTQNLGSIVTVRMTIPKLNIIQGRYSIDVWLGNHLDLLEDHVESTISFEVINKGHSKVPLRSIIHETGKWKIVNK
ncbi:MAG: ATP-binding cassette domain-containing protein [Planctomycetia bacterium]|nr:ATP-binding cassette domain-containing protein [Planctomycetia bacterium]